MVTARAILISITTIMFQLLKHIVLLNLGLVPTAIAFQTKKVDKESYFCIIELTANEKIHEAQYNLQKLKNANLSSKEFTFELSNFLNSAQSILYHLLEEYNIKYDLKIDFVNTSAFRSKSKELGNDNAICFIEWYQHEYDKIKNDRKFGFLMLKRHTNVHKGSVDGSYDDLILGQEKTFTITEGKDSTIKIDLTEVLKGANTAKVTITDKTTAKKEQIEIDAKRKSFFKENPDEDITTICAEFLERLKKMVSDAHSRF